MRPKKGLTEEADEDDDDDATFVENGVSHDEEPQDNAIRRKIRNDLRSMQSQTSRNRTELVSGNADELTKTLDEANRIFEEVKHCREAVLDAALMNSIAQLGKDKAQSIATDLQSFSSIEFTEKLITFIGGNGVDEESNSFQITRDGWIALGKGCHQYFKRSPPLHFMFGSFTKDPPEEKKRVERAVILKDKDSQKAPTAPRQVLSLQEMEQKEATTVEVERIYGILKEVYRKQGNSPICYFEFVINPSSFGQTVENIFYTSFLIKDGYAKVEIDRDKLPTIEPVERRDEDLTVTELPYHQMLLSITKEYWQNIIRTYNIEKPLIKTREQGRLGGRNSSEPSGSGKSSGNLSSQNGPATKKTKHEDAKPSTSSQGSRSVWESVPTIRRQPLNGDVEPESDQAQHLNSISETKLLKRKNKSENG